MGKCAGIKKILIVEDDRVDALALRKMIEKCGDVIISSVDSGEDAIEKAGTMKPDIVLMDITLNGELDGVEAAGIISSKHSIPHIYITSGTDDATFERAKETMPSGFIIKPFNRNMLVSTIELGLHRYEIEKRLLESEKHNRDIIESIPDVMFNLKKDGSFVDSSKAAIARKIWPEQVARHASGMVRKAVEADSPESFEYSIEEDPYEKYYEARIIPSAEDTALVIVRDITKAKLAEKELLEYKESLERRVEERTAEIVSVNKTLQNEIRLREASERSIRVFSYAINQMPFMAIIVNPKAQIEYVNTRFLEISGFAMDEVVGADITKPGNPVLPEPELWQVITAGEKWRNEMYGLSKSGEIYYTKATVSRIMEDDEANCRYIILADDITAERRERMELERIRETISEEKIGQIDMEMNWREWKDMMVARNVSRSDRSLFRNINNSFTQGAGFGAMITLFEMLMSGAEDKGSRTAVDSGVLELIGKNIVIAQNAFKVFSTIDWIIGNEFELGPVTLKELHYFVRMIISDISDFLTLRNQKIIINELDPLIALERININREYLYSALRELLLNAMKFSKKNTIIAVMLHNSGSNAVISIVNDPEKADENITGVPPEYEKAIFEPFYRLSKYVYDSFGTLDFGVGLTMVDKIVQRHGGEIVAHNVLDHSDLKRDPLVKVNVSATFPLILK